MVSNTFTPFTPVAVVTIGTPKDVIRTDSYEIGNNMITVHTRGFRLLQMAPGYQGDVVIWAGDSYLVKKSYNWSHFGAGFTMAECELQQVTTTT
jgi:hypothetical protein